MKTPPIKHRTINRRDALAALGLVTIGLATTARAHHGSGAEVADQLVMGAADAPVTMIEFSSLTCPHCAEFEEKGFPRLRDDDDD